MRNIVVLLVLSFCTSLLAQKEAGIQFGSYNQYEEGLKVFQQDTTAAAVYLYEYGDNYFEVRNNRVWLITKYHARIKILKKEGFDQASVAIPYYHNDRNTEKVLHVKAITHNNELKTRVEKESIFDVKDSNRWSSKKFTFPKVSIGSILEYAYEIQSPFYYNLNGWNFQSNIPKIYTEYNARIPGNWLYNRTLTGELKLDINQSSVTRNCFSVPDQDIHADCEDLTYIMKNVPAFNDSEEFMLSSKNYKSRLEFELAEYNSFYGAKEKYTKSWNDVDKEFRLDKDIGRQLRKKNFFEKNVPDSLFIGSDILTKAKNIYSFVQNHFVWNGEYGVWKDNKVKDAFDNRNGNAAEINITLINLLNSADIKTDMMLIGTRQRGLPKKNNPVMADFNYIIVKTKINGQDYLLDATDKTTPFGMLPYRCLNYYGRVMDFKAKSYWHEINAEKDNKVIIRTSALLDMESGSIKGVFNTINSGYYAINKRKSLANVSNQEYLEKIENDYLSDFFITSYELKESLSNKKKVIEKFNFEIENFLQDGDIYLNPFFIKFFNNNPFTSAKRNYPIDFGYIRNNNYSLSLKIPEGYRVKSLPEAKNLALPENSGLLRFECKEQGDKVLNVYFDFKINATQYNSEAYEFIKLFFEEAVLAQTKSYIVLEKV
ncbi:DUF3857 domain-containing protein [uncultured Croceitalea sp.]|uniref:DUF3857 domain-containing protein n=1 Tax=uncultured Croceitalea sp. TaxID=1798908 RepID=UPI00330685BD